MRHASSHSDFRFRRARTLLGRALLRRCPLCGGAPLFRRWIVMRQDCPRCGLRLDRGETDYFLGGYLVNFVTAELLVVIGGLLAILLTWPEVPWTAVQWGLILTMVPAPVVSYPWSKTLWLAVDLFFRPPRPEDFRGDRSAEVRAILESGRRP